MDETEQNICINNDSVIRFSGLTNIHKSFEIAKSSYNAIDKLGNVFTLENSTLKCSNFLTNHLETLNIDFEFSLQQSAAGTSLQKRNSYR